LRLIAKRETILLDGPATEFDVELRLELLRLRF